MRIVRLFWYGALTIIYIRFIGNGFVWLDHGDIELGRALLSISKWYIAFIRPLGTTGFYRPVITILHSFDFALFGLWAPGYHATNILLHLSVAAIAPYVVDIFIKISKREKFIVFLTAMVHPVIWIVVGAISYRQEMVVAVGAFGTLAVFAKYIRTGSYWYLIALTILSVVTIFSKETGIFYLFFLLGLYIWVKRADISFRRTSFGFISVAVVMFSYLLLRILVVGEGWRVSYVPMDWEMYIGTRFAAWGRMMGWLVVPFAPSIADTTPIVSIWSLVAFFPFVIFLFCAVGIAALLRWRRGEGALLGFILISTLPALQIIPAPRFSSPHYGYTAAVLSGVMWVLVLRKLRWSAFIFWGWAIVGAWMLFSVSPRLADDFSLFSPEVVRNDLYREGHQYLGDYYFFGRGESSQVANEQRYEKAVEHYKRALRSDPGMISFVSYEAVKHNLELIQGEK